MREKEGEAGVERREEEWNVFAVCTAARADKRERASHGSDEARYFA